jgi:uncharacterized protein (TIRG00374 family)
MKRILKDSLRWLPGALISIVLVAVIFHYVDFEKVADAIRSADYGLLGVSLALSFLWMVVRGLVWRILLRERATYMDAFLAEGEGALLNAFLPFRLGEFGRAFLLGRKSGLQFAEILPTIVIERVIDVGFSAVLLLASLPFVIGASDAGKIGTIAGAAVLIGLVGLYLLARDHRWALDFFHRLSGRWPVLQRLGGSFLESFFRGLDVLTDGWLFARFMFWMTFNWVIAVLNYYYIILAFFPQAKMVWAMFVLGAAAFGGAVPSPIPGAVGTFEAAFGGALVLLAANQSTALAAALMARLFNYLTSGVIGGYALSVEGQTLGSVYQQLRRLRAGEKTANDE